MLKLFFILLNVAFVLRYNDGFMHLVWLHDTFRCNVSKCVISGQTYLAQSLDLGLTSALTVLCQCPPPAAILNFIRGEAPQYQKLKAHQLKVVGNNYKKLHTLLFGYYINKVTSDFDDISDTAEQTVQKNHTDTGSYRLDSIAMTILITYGLCIKSHKMSLKGLIGVDFIHLVDVLLSVGRFRNRQRVSKSSGGRREGRTVCQKEFTVQFSFGLFCVLFA